MAQGSAMSFVFALRMTYGGFLEAASALAPVWEDVPSAGARSPRQVAEHAVAGELSFAGWIAEAMGWEKPAGEATFPTAGELLDSGRRALQAVGELYVSLANEDLERPCPGHARLQAELTAAGQGPPDGWPPATIAATLALALGHVDEHARELRRLAGASQPA